MLAYLMPIYPTMREGTIEEKDNNMDTNEKDGQIYSSHLVLAFSSDWNAEGTGTTLLYSTHPLLYNLPG